MAQCKFCGCSSWFFLIDASGLCTNCSHIVALDVEQRSRLLQDYTRAADETQNPHSKLARWDLMLKQLEALSKYEERGIPTIEGSPSATMSDLRSRRDELILATARADLDEILKSVADTPVPEKKVAFYSKILLRMAEFRKMMTRTDLLDALERQVKEAVHQIRLNVPLEKAKAAELKGKRDKALEHYREALVFLTSSDPDRAALKHLIPRIEEKIRELGGNAGTVTA